MKISHLITLLPIIFLSGCASVPVTPDVWNIEPVSLYDSGHEKGTEIISVQQSTLRAVLSNFETGEVDVLDVSRPRHLQRKARFALNLSKGEELTSVAFHPKVIALGKIGGDEDKSPEGIAHFIVDGEHYLLTANEMNGTVECFKIIRNDSDKSNWKHL